MLFLGRNTLQWLAGVAIMLQIAGQFFSTVSPTVKLVLDFLTALDAGIMAWVAQTSTTPVTSPRLVAGTPVQLLDGAGKTTGATGVVTKS